jgi:tRNA(adenine34) deaminase
MPVAGVPYETFMLEALSEARLAGAAGDVPIGCVVVHDDTGRIIGRGRNRREVDRDPTAHAEILAMREAAVALGQWRLVGCTLVVTLEPCPMCAGAIVNARVARVVFGTADPKAGAAGSVMNLLNDARLNHQAEVIAGTLADACALLLREFFQRQRAMGKK